MKSLLKCFELFLSKLPNNYLKFGEVIVPDDPGLREIALSMPHYYEQEIGPWQ